MARYMVDTSALVKYYHPEIGSSRLIAIVDDTDNVRFTSRLGLVEIHSALARKVRTGELQLTALQQALRRFYADVRGRRFRLIRPATVHERQAIRLLVRKAPVFPLRTLDALQLAAALWLQTQQQLDYFLCADPKLCEVAHQEGLSVINPEEP